MSPLTGDRWRRLEALFHQAVDLHGAELEAWLARETQGDASLRQELEQMLSGARSAPEWIASTVRGAARAATSGGLAGQRMGPYRLIREIGRGGMGIVYEACRDDDEYRKTVALKVAPDWRDPGGFGSRLRGERQILAALEHPNIARFLDGGTENGVPYFAMEFVEGSPITEYCAQRKLDVPSRIALFREVCAAVSCAHENLVVHRDLKPANILVDRSGAPKLLDFGIARLLGSLPDAAPTAGRFLWTPDYGSPEQVRGAAITIRTDVYSLGLVLYEMLCGARAQQADTSSPLALDRSICEAEAAPASARAAASGERALSRQLKGDLDTILAKAMAKEPERRYGSAAELSADLERYLDGRPVKARPGTFFYRAGKVAKRHRAAVAATVLVAVSLGAGVAATLAQARRTEQRYRQVRRLANSMLFGVHDRIQHLAGATEAREWAVKTALEYLDSLSQDARQDPSLAYEMASAYVKAGDVQGYPVRANLGHPAAAAESYGKALGIAEALAAHNPSPAVQRLLALTHQRRGAMLRVSRQALPAITEFTRALSIEEPVYAAHAGEPEDSELIAVILVSRGQSEVGVGRIADANRDWMRALEVARLWDRVRPGDDARARLASGNCMVSRGLQYAGDLDGAEQHARECAAIRREMADAHPEHAEFRRESMNACQQMAYVYWHDNFLSFGDRAAAAPLLQQAVAIARDLAAADSSNATAQFDLAIAESDLCTTLSEPAPDAALPHCRAALDIAARYPARMNMSATSAGMAGALERMGRHPEALRAMRDALAAARSAAGADPARVDFRRQVTRLQGRLARLLLSGGGLSHAAQEQRAALADAEALAAAEPANPVAQRDLADAYHNAAAIAARSAPGSAAEWYAKELAIWTAWPRIAPSTRMDRARRAAALRRQTANW